ncbi:hypothetical protein PSNIH2_14920 [Pantoea sp. PSNIH2]|nr:hypothetical protein PSNIH2_14920 [Pantoea sp. PSNIH2]
MHIFAGQYPLGAADFPVQGITPALADNPPAPVHLNAMPAAVIKMPDFTSVRQSGNSTVAQLVVLMLQNDAFTTRQRLFF